MVPLSHRAVHADGIPAPSLHDQFSDANVGAPRGGLLEGHDEWVAERGGDELTELEIDFLAAKAEADEKGLGVYLLTAGEEFRNVAAPDANAAYRKGRGWTSGDTTKWPSKENQGPIKVETVIPPPSDWGDFEMEVRIDCGWADFGTVRACSAVHALQLAREANPELEVRPKRLWSQQAERMIA